MKLRDADDATPDGADVYTAAGPDAICATVSELVEHANQLVDDLPAPVVRALGLP